MAVSKKANRELKQWRGRFVKHLDSIAHLRLLRHTPMQIRDFARRSLDAPSEVPVQSFDDILLFLMTCTYVSDRELHGQAEVWQTPDVFETIRKGDCEEHALWSWKMLVKIGQKARFTIGKYRGSGHAWVTLFGRERPFVFEGTSVLKASPGRVIFPASQAMDYRPTLSVDPQLKVYQHPR